MKSWPLVYKLVGAALHRDKQSLNQSRRKAALNCPLPAILFAGLALFISSCAPQSHDAINALIVVGPSTHPPGSHEVEAGGRLIEYCLEKLKRNISKLSKHRVKIWK